MDPEKMYRSFGMTPKVSAGKRGVKPKFVKLAPVDRGEYLPDVFFEDPRNFQPKPGPLGQVHCWGLFPYDAPEKLPDESPVPKDTKNWPTFDGVANMLRQMSGHDFTYRGRYGITTSLEYQFVDALIDRKKKQLKTHDLQGLDRRDVICKITLIGVLDKDGNHRIWRWFKVSAGISIQALQDKIIAPLMGWVRNFHCYIFTDYRDGSLFGPEYSTSVDSVHIANVGYDYLPDDKYKFAHLFGKKGDQVGYLYDFGDRWQHHIDIEEILPEEQSSGAVQVIDGRGMCPGENMDGNLEYAKFLVEYDKANYAEKMQMKRQVLESPNYKHFGKPPALFDPSKFDLEATEKRVTDALNSRISVSSGAKVFTMPMMPGIEPPHGAFVSPHGHQSLSVKHDNETHGYWQETVSNTKDKLRVAVCAACGKPASGDVALKTCSGCRKVMYCSVAHQKDHWKVVHKKECTREFLPK